MMTPQQYVEAVGAVLTNCVPGLMVTYIGPSYLCYSLELKAEYACPCGEVSHLSRVFDPGMLTYAKDLAPFVDEEAGMLIRLLRDHVRSEGNEPNF